MTGARSLDWLAALGGLLLVIGVVTDIFRSLLLPRESRPAFRVQPVLTRLLFTPWSRATARMRDARTRQGVRAVLAPLLLVLSLFVWVGMLMLGYGLLFWAARADFQPALTGLPDALFQAGGAFTTVGTASTAHGWARLAVIGSGLSGIAIITVVATFVLSIQSGFGEREALVLRLEAHVTLPPSGVAVLETYALEHVEGRLGAFFSDWEQWAATVATTHRAYPILVFFRSNDARCEWLAALGAVLDAAALLDATIVEAPTPAYAGAHFVLRTGGRMLRVLCALFRLPPDDNPPIDLKRLAEHRERLAAAGYRLRDDVDEAARLLAERRALYIGWLRALARRLAIEVVDAAEAGRESAPRQINRPAGAMATEPKPPLR